MNCDAYVDILVAKVEAAIELSDYTDEQKFGLVTVVANALTFFAHHCDLVDAMHDVKEHGHTGTFRCWGGWVHGPRCERMVLFSDDYDLLCDECREKERGEVCYFASAPMHEALPEQIRIGRTTRARLGKRMCDEGGLIPVRVEAGGAVRERELHQRYAHLHISGSWYRLEDGLLEYLADELAPMMASARDEVY